MTTTSKPSHQLTGNAGLYHVAAKLSRLGWHAMPTIRNARGSDLVIGSNDTYFGVQSKALAKKSNVFLGDSLEKLESKWWVITLDALTDTPTCYILSIEEVRALAVQSSKGAWHLVTKCFMREEFKEAWHRIGSPF